MPLNRKQRAEKDPEDLKPIELKQNDAIWLCKKTTDIDVIIELTKHASPVVRKSALHEMCPCQVKKDLSEFWARVLEMIDDESELVRYQVLHTICDGSPAHMEDDVVRCLEVFNHDSDSKIRRQANRVLAAYRHTGKWNIL